MDINDTSVYFALKVCFNGVFGGIVVAYVAMSLCFILGTPAHFWFLWLYLRAGWKIKPTQVFPLNMIILELIFSIQCAFQVTNLLIFKSDVLLTVIFTVAGSCWVGRPLMQICICFEQYLAVCQPIMFLKYNSVQHRIAAAVVVCLIIIGYAVYQNVYARSFPNPMFNMFFSISVIVVSVCCLSVLRALKHPGPGDTQIPVERGRDVGNQQKRKAFKTIFSGLLIILFTYLPQVSLSLVNISNIDKILFNCSILPTISTLNVFSVIITTLLKMHKMIVSKRANYLKEEKDNS